MGTDPEKQKFRPSQIIKTILLVGGVGGCWERWCRIVATHRLKNHGVLFVTLEPDTLFQATMPDRSSYPLGVARTLEIFTQNVARPAGMAVSVWRFAFLYVGLVVCMK